MAMNTALKIAFIESGKKQIDVAAAIGMDNTKLSQIIHGRRDASDDDRRALAKALRRPISQLFPEVTA